jgi:iron(III) transport system ATP-binding protein
MSYVIVQNISKSFAKKHALKSVLLEVEKNSIMAIVGPSGSGKTTLLRLIAGFERPDRGSIQINERYVEGPTFVKPEARRIGYVPQEGSLFPHLTVLQNVSFQIGKKGKDKAESLLELLGIGHLASKYPHQISGGEQQRVAIARALSIGPELLLLDEPFSSLDPQMRPLIRDEIKNVLKENSVTTLMVTHDSDEALSFPDKLAVLHDGEILQTGSPKELYENYNTITAGKTLGQLNVLECPVVNGRAITPFGEIDIDKSELSTAKVAIRPEDIKIEHIEAPGANLHDREAKVYEICHVAREYYGHDAILKLQLRLNNSQEMISLITRPEGPNLDLKEKDLVFFKAKSRPKVFF